jgi:hypothetical protein
LEGISASAAGAGAILEPSTTIAYAASTPTSIC